MPVLRLAGSRALILVACLLGFGLRVSLLDKQSLWGDEGASLSYALSSGLDVLLERVLATDPHSPLYYGLLHVWLGLTGESDFAIRWPSVFFGLLIVPLAYTLARRVSWRAGLPALAAFLTAVSPFLVYYSQEARMYSMAVLLSLLALYGLLRAVSGGGWWWLVHVLAGIVALYTLGVTIAIIPAGTALILWGLARQRWEARYKLLLPALASWVILVGSVVFWNRLQIGQFGQFLSLTDLRLAPLLALDTLKEALLVSVFGITLDPLYSAARSYQTIDSWGQVFQPAYTVVAAALCLGLVSMGLLKGLRNRAPVDLLLTAFFVLAVWAEAYFLRMATTRYASRLLLIGSPFVLLLIALGLDALPRRALKAVAATLIFVAMGYSLGQNYENPVFARGDYRSLASYLERQKGPGDAVYLHGPPLRLLDSHYRPAADAAYSVPRSAPVGSTWPEVAEQLQGLADRHSRLWLVLGSEIDYDPERRVERWLTEHGYQVEDQWFGNNRLALYVFPPPAALSEMPYQQVPESGLALVSVGVSRVEETQAGVDIPLFLRWRLVSRPEGVLRLSLRLRDEAGYMWAQRDEDLGGHLNPLSRWPLNEPVSTRTGLRLPAGLPPGNYMLQAVVYESGLPSSAGNFWSKSLRVVRGGPVDASRLTPPVRADVPLGPLHIIGYYLPDKPSPGAKLPLRLYWMVEGYPAEDYQLVVRLGNGPDQVLPLMEGNLYDGGRQGEGFITQNLIKVPATASGRQPVMVGLSGGPGGPLVRLAEIQVETVNRIFVEPAAREILNVNLGGEVELIGLDLAAAGANRDSVRITPGQALDVALYWKGLVEMESSYTVFVQLLDSQGRLVAQRDAVPSGGRRPSTGWLPGEVISDAHRLEIPASIRPGNYELIAGMYETNSGRRLMAGRSDYVRLAGAVVADE